MKNVQRLVTNDCSQMYDGQVKYSPMCNENGELSTLLCTGERKTILMCQCSKSPQDVVIKQHIRKRGFQDISDELSLLALQGPKAQEILCS